MANVAKDSDGLRIGVFVCECGLNIAGTIDCNAVSEYARTLDDVAAVIQNKYTCADPGQNEIKKAITEHNLHALRRFMNLLSESAWPMPVLIHTSSRW